MRSTRNPRCPWPTCKREKILCNQMAFKVKLAPIKTKKQQKWDIHSFLSYRGDDGCQTAADRPRGAPDAALSPLVVLLTVLSSYFLIMSLCLFISLLICAKARAAVDTPHRRQRPSLHTTHG